MSDRINNMIFGTLLFICMSGVAVIIICAAYHVVKAEFNL